MLSNFPIRKLDPKDFPPSLFEIPEPPKQLFIRGVLPPPSDYIYLVVVGSRKYTNYGKLACEKLIEGLRGYPICIISGLALGIDAIAHESALKAGLKTIAFLGSGLGEKVLYPKSNIGLAKRILESEGCLLSEMEEHEGAAQWTFPRRNRLKAGMTKAILIIEAELKSGTLITARLGTEYNKDVLAVPGSIFSPQSEGTHMLIRLGATPIRSSEELLDALGFEVGENDRQNKNYDDCTQDEQALLEAISDPLPRDEILEKLNWDITRINMTLTLLEIKGHIKEIGGKVYKL